MRAEDLDSVGVRKMSNLNPLTSRQIADAKRDPIYIFNTSPNEHRLYTDRLYVIPPCEEGKAYSKPLVLDGIIYTTALKSVSGMDVAFEWLPSDGLDVAKDILGTGAFKGPTQNITRLGVFMSMSATPAAEEVEKAREQWMQRCAEKVAAADGQYLINGGRVDIGNGMTASNIGKDAIEAANALGIERPWTGKLSRMVPCEGCGQSVSPQAVRCPHASCGAVLNEEKARKLFPHLYAHETKPARQREPVAA